MPLPHKTLEWCRVTSATPIKIRIAGYVAILEFSGMVSEFLSAMQNAHNAIDARVYHDVVINISSIASPLLITSWRGYREQLRRDGPCCRDLPGSRSASATATAWHIQVHYKTLCLQDRARSDAVSPATAC